jgi:hypothetical protein
MAPARRRLQDLQLQGFSTWLQRSANYAGRHREIGWRNGEIGKYFGSMKFVLNCEI